MQATEIAALLWISFWKGLCPSYYPQVQGKGKGSASPLRPPRQRVVAPLQTRFSYSYKAPYLRQCLALSGQPNAVPS